MPISAKRPVGGRFLVGRTTFASLPTSRANPIRPSLHICKRSETAPMGHSEAKLAASLPRILIPTPPGVSWHVHCMRRRSEHPRPRASGTEIHNERNTHESSNRSEQEERRHRPHFLSRFCGQPGAVGESRWFRSQNDRRGKQE